MNKLNSSPFPILTTPRLVLRQLLMSDNPAIFKLRSNEALYKYLDRPIPRNLKDSLNNIQRLNQGVQEGKWLYWVILLQEYQQLIGTFSLWNFSEDYKTAEVGYELDPTFQRQGFMDEALKSVLLYGFQSLKLIAIDAYTHQDNQPSINLLQRNGFQLDSSRKDKYEESNIVFRHYGF